MVMRVDLLDIANNVDLHRVFTLTTGAATSPWAAVPAWMVGASYQSGASPSIVTYNGDLYFPSAAAPASWTAGATFAAEADWWSLVAQAAAWASSPYALTGKTLVLNIAAAQSDGISPVLPPAPLLALSSAGASPCLVIGGGSNNQVTLAVPALRMRGLPPGAYCYDLVAIGTDGARDELFFGAVTIRQGAS